MGIGRWFDRGRAGAFARDRGGNVAMMWGLMGTVLVGLIGITVDFTRAQALQAHMQNAADGAALVAERSSNLALADREAASVQRLGLGGAALPLIQQGEIVQRGADIGVVGAQRLLTDAE